MSERPDFRTLFSSVRPTARARSAAPQRLGSNKLTAKTRRAQRRNFFRVFFALFVSLRLNWTRQSWLRLRCSVLIVSLRFKLLHRREFEIHEFNTFMSSPQ